MTQRPKMLRRLILAFTLATVLLSGNAASAQEVAGQDNQQALQKKFAWAVEAARGYIARTEGWPESDFAIVLKVENPDQPKAVIARVVRRDSPFFGWEECIISPPICWNELHFAVETREVFYMVWGN
jgi:hypothetical protein